MSASTMWIVLVATSALCFAIKLLGHFVPESWLANARLQRINALIPICLLSALVVAQGFVVKTHVVLDHRLAGLARRARGALREGAVSRRGGRAPPRPQRSSTTCTWLAGERDAEDERRHRRQ